MHAAKGGVSYIHVSKSREEGGMESCYMTVALAQI